MTPSNALADGYIASWPQWPARGCIILGPRHSGKTHLTHLWQIKTQGQFLAAEDLLMLEKDLHVHDGQCFILENIETILAQHEVILFHLFNQIQSHKGFLLITAVSHPKDWPVTLKDLASRLATLPIFTIEEPDDVLFTAILAKNFSDYQMQVLPKVLDFIVHHVERTFENAWTIPDVLNKASLTHRHAVTIPFVKDVLGL